MTYSTRFAPSPTGPLHLGHAYSALLAHDRANAANGRFLVRIENIDRARSRPDYETAIFDDLAWLGLSWLEPVLRQSERSAAYDVALSHLVARGFCYPCHCTRGDIRAALSAPQEAAATGPDGPVYPGTCRHRRMADAGPDDAIRLNIGAAIRALGGLTGLGFTESGPLHPGHHTLDTDSLTTGTGDIVLARKSLGTSYHLAVVVDDAHQDITEVVRGADLFAATALHRLLQALLDLPTPDFHHHRLIRDDTGKRLAKRDDARAIARYRADGATRQDIRRMVGLD